MKLHHSTPRPEATNAAQPPSRREAVELLTDNQAAEFLSIKPRTLRLWRHSRGLPFIRITSKVIRYRRADIEQWLDRCRVVIRVN